MCTATKSISKSGNMSCYQHVAHARLATLARALSHSLTLKPGSAHRLTDCTRARSLSLSRSAALPLSRCCASADLSRRSLPRPLSRCSAAAAAPFLRPVHIFISAHSDVDVSVSAHCVRLLYSPRVLFVGVQVHFRFISLNKQESINVFNCAQRRMRI